MVCVTDQALRAARRASFKLPCRADEMRLQCRCAAFSLCCGLHACTSPSHCLVRQSIPQRAALVFRPPTQQMPPSS